MAIYAFANGSEGGLGGLRPQHLKKVCDPISREGSPFIGALASVVDLMLRDQVPEVICPVLYGANLIALRKKDGGIRSIAVGTTLRRPAARIVSNRSKDQINVLNPIQISFATKGGAEAATRHFIENSTRSLTHQAFLKVDVKNAFNSVDRNTILKVAQRDLPAFYPFVWQCYSAPTFLMCRGRLILSQRGVHQGDPLGPPLFCLSTIDFHRGLRSRLVSCYLDDDVLGGDVEAVLSIFAPSFSERKAAVSK